MAAVKNKNTKPELIIRKLLYASGYRYRVHGIKLPGKPDIVMHKHKAVIFIHGCFWHGHGCNLSKSLPKTRKEFWESKIINNKARDERTVDKLLLDGWRVCTIWDCALQRKNKLATDVLFENLNAWIKGEQKLLIISGKPNIRGDT